MGKISPIYWPIAGIILVSILIIFYLFKANFNIFDDIVTDKVIPKEAIKLENIHYVQDNPDEHSKWILDAQEASFSKDGQRLSFQDFILRIESENDPSLELKGKAGNYDRESGEINLWGELKGFTDNGYTISTERLLYQQNEGLLQSQEKVRIVGPFFDVTGQGLLVDVRKKVLKILKDTVTRIDGESLSI